MFAKDLMGNKHYYYRFYNENGIELYTMEKKREVFQTVFIPCEGFMVGIDQRHRLEEILKWLPTLEHGIRGEIERVFNEEYGRSEAVGRPGLCQICWAGTMRQNGTIFH